jgi:nucleotide-binding universal stress UspA family protein
MVNHILVAVDGSETATRAAHYARDLAKQTGAHLTLLIVITPPSAVAVPPFDVVSITRAHPDEKHIAAARAVMDEVEAALGAQASARVAISAKFAETICEEARKERADLLVVGARGLGAVERVVLGSVSEKVLREADRPVLVVR